MWENNHNLLNNLLLNLVFYYNFVTYVTLLTKQFWYSMCVCVHVCVCVCKPACFWAPFIVIFNLRFLSVTCYTLALHLFLRSPAKERRNPHNTPVEHTTQYDFGSVSKCPRNWHLASPFPPPYLTLCCSKLWGSYGSQVLILCTASVTL
jgi:hypothetical protein